MLVKTERCILRVKKYNVFLKFEQAKIIFLALFNIGRRSEDLRMPYINKEASHFRVERKRETFSSYATHVRFSFISLNLFLSQYFILKTIFKHVYYFFIHAFNIKIWFILNLWLFKQVDNYVVEPQLKHQHKQPNVHKDVGTHGEKDETVTNSLSSPGLYNTKEEMVRETHCMTKTGIDYHCLYFHHLSVDCFFAGGRKCRGLLWCHI